MERSSFPSNPPIIPAGFLGLIRNRMAKSEGEGNLPDAKAARELLAEAEQFVFGSSADRIQYDSLLWRIKKFVGVKIL